jgi:hypothetical protein
VTVLARPTASKGPRANDNGSNTDTSHPDDFRLSPRVFSQTLLEQTGTVDAIVNVMHDLFPDNDNTEEGVNGRGDGDAVASPLQDDDTPRTNDADTPDAVADAARSQKQQQQQRLDALLFPLIELLAEMSSHEGCAEVLVVTGALHYVLYVLENVSGAQDELLPLCLLILWNSLELSHEKLKRITTCASRKELLIQFRLRNAIYFLGNEFTLHALLRTLELLLRHGYRPQDKALRNETLMILLLLAKRRKTLDVFYSAGVTNCLFSYATAAEHARAQTGGEGSVAASAITANVHLYATSSDDDFEFKQTLWFLLAEISHDHAFNMGELVQFRFMESLFSYALISSASSSSTSMTSAALKYSVPQLQILQVTALSVLNHVVAPFALDQVYELRAHERLVDFLHFSSSTEAVLTAAWLLLVQVAAPEPFYQSALGECGAVELAVAQFGSPSSRYTFAMRRNAIIACANMCRGHELNRERFFDANGVHLLAENLEIYDAAHAILEENLIIGVLEAVRSCVVGDTRNEEAFVNVDGVPRLLSVLVQVPKAIKHQTLAALAEICVNPAAIPSYMDWRCDRSGAYNNASANEVLLRIYADEEEAEALYSSNMELAQQTQLESATATRLVAADSIRHSSFQSITTCSNPIIVSSTGPTNTSNNSNGSPRPESPAFARLKEALRAAQSLSVDQAHASLRSNVLALTEKQVHPEVSLKSKIHAVLANVTFACDTEKLTPRDQVMLEVAKEYPMYRVGEMWQNVQLELHAEGVRPIYADALFIRKQIEQAYNTAVCTKHAQQEIFSRAKSLSMEQEDTLFRQILLQKRQEEQAARFQRANKLQNSTLRLHFDAKKTRLEFMKRQDPTAFASYESEEHCHIDDPPPEYVDSEEGAKALELKEQELRGRMSTIAPKRK